MRYLRFLPFFILTSLLGTAAEEMSSTVENSCKPISQKEFEKWDPYTAIRALGIPPGPVMSDTYKMLISSWAQ